MTKSPHDQMLGRDNPLDFWMQEASLHTTVIKSISPAEALAIIRSAFSTSWIDKIVSAPEKGTAIQSSRHPLASLILLPGKKQTKRVLELGAYLRDLYNVPNLDQVIRQMKSAEDFENTWVQLAYGYRFLKLGVKDLKFEPDIDDGRKADLVFNFESQAYLVECFMPEVKDSWQVEFTTRTQKQIFDFVTDIKKIVCIKAALREAPAFSHDERKLFERAWKKVIQQVTDFTPMVDETDFYKIQAQEISHLNQIQREQLFNKMFNEENCRYACKQALMDKSDALNTMRGKGKQTECRDLLFFHSEKAEETMADLVTRLAKKMEKKVDQLRMKEANAKGLLIVATSLIHPNNLSEKAPFDRMHGKVVRAHSHVEAAILVHPADGPAGDPRYSGTIFQTTETPKAGELLNRLEALEIKGPLL
ncbi:MAG: hypothetical protein H7235_03665 [Bdellovibrionaceae bacterium]|nr:hypothetical protein [Pseudobdellovibrionaceae bacterium]